GVPPHRADPIDTSRGRTAGTVDSMDRGARALSTGRWMIAAALVAAGLAACGSQGPKGTSATDGHPAAAPTRPASTTQAGAEPCTFAGATDPARAGVDAPTRLLTDVRVGVHDCYERVTFELQPRGADADGPAGGKAAYEPGPIT